MRAPDFLVVGAARAGTTTLDSYLRQHPEIFLPKIKEPCFFVFDEDKKVYKNGKFAFAVRDFKSYENLYHAANPSQLIGEMSTPYLYLHDKTISTIRKYFADYRKIKIVMMLRNPVDRAYSQYCWRVRDGREPLSFEKAIQAEKERMQNNFSFDYFYLDRGFYFKQVKAYMENFENVHIMWFEDFQAQPFVQLKNLCRFLGIDDSFNFMKVDDQNSSYGAKISSLGRVMTSESKLKFKIWYTIPVPLRKKIRQLFSKMNEGKKPELELSAKQLLSDLYRDDILELQKLTGRDLSSWL